jgi:curved DNA-binding protein CbpA
MSSVHRTLRILIALLVALCAAAEEERNKINHAERLLSKVDPDGKLLKRASDFTRQTVSGVRTLLPEETEKFRERILNWARKPNVAEILRNPPSESQGITFERLSRKVNERLDEKLRQTNENRL